MKSRTPAPHEAARALPVTFRVGAHSLSITWIAEGRWTVSLDGGLADQTFRTEADAWEAGVRAADELDRLRRP